MIDNKTKAPLPPETPLTVANLERALAELIAQLPEWAAAVPAGRLVQNAGALTLMEGSR